MCWFAFVVEGWILSCNLLNLFITPIAAFAEEIEEEKEEDYFFPVTTEKLSRKRTFDDMTFDELAADLGISFMFERKIIVIKVYSPPSKAYQSISFRVPEEHTGVLTSEEIHQWEDTFHICQEDFDIGGDLRNGWEDEGLHPKVAA